MRDNDALSPFGRKAIEASSKQETGQDSKPKGPVKLSPLARQMAEQYQHDTFSPLMLSGVMRMVEFGLVFCSGILSFLLYVGIRTHLVFYYPLIMIVGGALFVLLMEINDGYQINILRSPGRYLRRLFISWAAVLGTLAIAGFLLKASSDFSRGWFLYWALSACVLLLIARIFVAWKIKRWARNGTMERRAVIVGGGPNAEALIRSLEQQPDNDIRICGIFDDRDDKRSPPSLLAIPSSAISTN